MITQQHIDTLLQAADQLANELSASSHAGNPDIISTLRRISTLQECRPHTGDSLLTLANAAGRVNDLVTAAAAVGTDGSVSFAHALGSALTALVGFQMELTSGADSFGIRTYSEEYGGDTFQRDTFVSMITSATNLAYASYAKRIDDQVDREIIVVIGDFEGSPWNEVSLDDEGGMMDLGWVGEA